MRGLDGCARHRRSVLGTALIRGRLRKRAERRCAPKEHTDPPHTEGGKTSNDLDTNRSVANTASSVSQHT